MTSARYKGLRQENNSQILQNIFVCIQFGIASQTFPQGTWTLRKLILTLKKSGNKVAADHFQKNDTNKVDRVEGKIRLTRNFSVCGNRNYWEMIVSGLPLEAGDRPLHPLTLSFSEILLAKFIKYLIKIS